MKSQKILLVVSLVLLCPSLWAMEGLQAQVAAARQEADAAQQELTRLQDAFVAALARVDQTNSQLEELELRLLQEENPEAYAAAMVAEQRGTVQPARQAVGARPQRTWQQAVQEAATAQRNAEAAAPQEPGTRRPWQMTPEELAARDAALAAGPQQAPQQSRRPTDEELERIKTAIVNRVLQENRGPINLQRARELVDLIIFNNPEFQLRTHFGPLYDWRGGVAEQEMAERVVRQSAARGRR